MLKDDLHPFVIRCDDFHFELAMPQKILSFGGEIFLGGVKVFRARKIFMHTPFKNLLQDSMKRGGKMISRDNFIVINDTKRDDNFVVLTQ